MSAAQARRCRGAHLLNDLRVLIRRRRIKAAFNTSSDNGLELRVRHTLRNRGDGGLEISRLSGKQPRARTRRDASTPTQHSSNLPTNPSDRHCVMICNAV